MDDTKIRRLLETHQQDLKLRDAREEVQKYYDELVRLGYVDPIRDTITEKGNAVLGVRRIHSFSILYVRPGHPEATLEGVPAVTIEEAAFAATCSAPPAFKDGEPFALEISCTTLPDGNGVFRAVVATTYQVRHLERIG